MTPFGNALIKARSLIASEAKQYICHALQATGGKQYTKRIEKLLVPSFSYCGWLAFNHPEVYTRMTEQDFRQGRLQWMDYLIAQEKAKFISKKSLTTI